MIVHAPCDLCTRWKLTIKIIVHAPCDLCTQWKLTKIIVHPTSDLCSKWWISTLHNHTRNKVQYVHSRTCTLQLLCSVTLLIVNFFLFWPEMVLFLSTSSQQLSRFSVALRWRVTLVKAKKKTNPDSCQTPISIIGYFSDMRHFTTLPLLHQLCEAFTTRPRLSGKRYFSTDLNWNPRTDLIKTWHWFCSVIAISDHRRLLPWWPRGVDESKTWDCCWIDAAQSNRELRRSCYDCHSGLPMTRVQNLINIIGWTFRLTFNLHLLEYMLHYAIKNS